MFLRLRNILAIPALFFGINGEPEKAYSQRPTTSIKKEIKQEPKIKDKWIFDKRLLIENEFAKKERYVNQIDNFSLNTDYNPHSANDQIQTISFISVGVLAIVALTVLCAKYKRDLIPTDEETKNALRKVFPEPEEELDNFENYIELENVLTSDSINPEERTNLIVLLRILSNSPRWSEFIRNELGNLQFEKKEQMTEYLKGNSSAYSEFQQAIYPSWKFGDLKLEGYTFTEDTYRFGREAKNYTIVLNDFKNLTNLLASVLCELNRIFVQESNSSKLPLTRLQAESLIGELNDLEEINQALSNNSLYKDVYKAFEQKIREDTEQFNKWRAAYFRYLAEVGSQPLTPSMDYFFK